MKHLYIPLLLFFIFITTLRVQAASPMRGYLVTKNGQQLTGFISEVVQSTEESLVVFINDFGNVYYINAQLVRGFVYLEEGQYVAYETKVIRRQHHFLRILEKGKALSLFKAPEQRVQLGYYMGSLQVNTFQVSEYYLQAPGKKITRIRQFGFKGKLRRLLRKQAPELSKKIGEEGYRFENLPEIIREYNRLCRLRQFST